MHERNWVIRRDGRVHTVRTAYAVFGRELSVYFDDVLACAVKVSRPKEYWRFQKDGHEFVISMKGWTIWTLSFELQVDGVKVEPTKDGPLAAPNAPVGTADLVSTRVDSKVLKVEVDSEVVTVPRGVKRTVKKSRTIARTVETTTTTKAGADVGVSIGFLTTKVQSEIEKKLGRMFQESETVEQTVDLDGNVHQRFQLTWYDRFRTGEISYRENGIVKNARFRFREGTELDVTEVK